MRTLQSPDFPSFPLFRDIKYSNSFISLCCSAVWRTGTLFRSLLPSGQTRVYQRVNLVLVWFGAEDSALRWPCVYLGKTKSAGEEAKFEFSVGFGKETRALSNRNTRSTSKGISTKPKDAICLAVIQVGG